MTNYFNLLKLHLQPPSKMNIKAHEQPGTWMISYYFAATKIWKVLFILLFHNCELFFLIKSFHILFLDLRILAADGCWFGKGNFLWFCAKNNRYDFVKWNVSKQATGKMYKYYLEQYWSHQDSFILFQKYSKWINYRT